ncbi:MAG: hypothetical protein U5R06_22000 [candidate division KSB1 bacterium]|nr:hypothetical protein [candidate division KSB1 bacterium]
MLNRSIFVFCLFCACVLFTGIGRTQSISEQLKQADCQFEIYYGDQKLDVIKQMITKRAVHFLYREGGYGHEAYFLEWAYKNDIEIDSQPNWVHFYNSSNQKIHSKLDLIRFENQSLKNKHFDKNTSIHYYGFSLEKVPMFVLDDTFKIVIIK